MVVKFTDVPNFKLKYLENQKSYFNQRFDSCVRIFKNLSYEINVYQ